jgi:hypothetical protein
MQKISPNPTDGDVYIDVESLDERDMRFEFFKVTQPRARAIPNAANAANAPIIMV